MLLLLVQSAAVAMWWTSDLGWGRNGFAAGAGLFAAQAVLCVPLRAMMLAAGRRAGGRRCDGLSRSLPLVGVALVISVLQATVVALGVGFAALGAGLLASYGFFSLASLWGAASMVAAVCGVFVVRVAFAFAPHRAVCGGHAAARALWFAPTRVLLVRAAALLVAGDVLTGLGALACGAGALPGYPLADLALMVLWEEEQP